MKADYTYPDVLAKYTAAFFKMSLSSVTRFNSAYQRHWMSEDLDIGFRYSI